MELRENDRRTEGFGAPKEKYAASQTHLLGLSAVPHGGAQESATHHLGGSESRRPRRLPTLILSVQSKKIQQGLDVDMQTHVQQQAHT